MMYKHEKLVRIWNEDGIVEISHSLGKQRGKCLTTIIAQDHFGKDSSLFDQWKHFTQKNMLIMHVLGCNTV